MKTRLVIKAFLMMVIFTTIVVSCKKDDPILKHENFFQVENELKIYLTQGFILDHGVHGASGDPSIRHLHCDFLTDGLFYDTAIKEFYGSGSRVSIAFFTNIDGQIPTGTYTFDHNSFNEAYTFNDGFIWENHNTVTGEGDIHDFEDGTVIVVNDENNNYDLTWLIKLSSGKSFDGTFKGKLTYYDVEP